MSTIFYSQVNRSVQRELIARGTAGTVNRTSADIDFMVGKIANVQLDAYDTKPTKETVPMSGFGTLGGNTVRTGAYMPSGPSGFLNDETRVSHRIPPVITDVSIAINDQSKSYINKANITILVPDALDMDGEFGIENIYCKPGRYIKVSIIHPDNALLTDGVLEDDKLPSTGILKTLYPNTDATDLRKMNKLYFQGRISTFSFSYNSDGSLTVTIEAIGTSNTYADIQVYMNNKKTTTATGQRPTNQIQSLYTSLNEEVDSIIASYNKDNISEFEHLVAKTTDQSILIGIPYIIGSSKPKPIRMISLGYLIQHINTKLTEQVGAKINCSDKLCKSNYYERLVSANPMNILLWRGKSNLSHDIYKFDVADAASGADLIIPPPTLRMFPNIKDVKTDGFSSIETGVTHSFPSRIYINLDILPEIIKTIDDDPTIKRFLIELGKEIKKNTGGAINMALIQDPIIYDALIYYDVNFITTTAVVNEFTLPVFATKTGRSVVREFSLTSNVPNSVKNMIFGIDSFKTGTQRQVAYNPYIYADAETKKELAEAWKNEYYIHEYSLARLKQTFAQRPSDSKTVENLIKELESYVSYFTPDIAESIGTNKSIFPMELDFTIDGINGFKFGDVLNFDGLPKRYTEAFVFTILGIEHKVSNEGEWTTTIKCNPRIRIKE
jgi:hypothetical protein